MKVNQLQEGLKTKLLGRNIIFFHEIDSTNKWAKDFAIDGAQEGTVIIAETQIKGKGRMDRRWFSPKGGLWFSLILKPKLRPSETVKLNFVAGLAVVKVLQEMFNLKAETKWPNDVMVNGLKICGILSEMNTTNEIVNFVIVGVGLNVNFDVKKVFPETVSKVSTSVENEISKKVQIEKVFRHLLETLEKLNNLFIEKGFDSTLEEWKKHASFLGCQVEVAGYEEKFSGLAIDVDQDGALLLKTQGNTVKRVRVGDVKIKNNR
ncbi:MAG: biotin--[acetyl-CoA-carboxylase] ligase [Candidatus Bathyarchaeota archaeon]|jgi:BirA family biotin operon repressor/biotin-[acetyl-CoA-carboxylase] ligase